MLNKIKVIGFLKKEQFENENKIEDINSTSQEAEKEVDQKPSEFEAEKENNRELWSSFKLKTWSPSLSKTTLQCFAERKTVERIKKEVGQEEVIEVLGYLRNRRTGLQIIIKVVEFSKVSLNFEKIDEDNQEKTLTKSLIDTQISIQQKEIKDLENKPNKTQAEEELLADKKKQLEELLKKLNQVRLIGKIINDLHPRKNKWDREILSFKLAVPREGVKLPLFFCRINEEDLITKSKEKLKKGDIILLEGFLQTQKIEVVKDDEIISDKVSSVNCYGFTFLDSDSVNIFSPLNNLPRVAAKEIRKNEFESDIRKE